MNTTKFILLIFSFFSLQSCGISNEITRFPTKSFVKVHTKMTLEICLESKKESVCSENEFYSVGSGAVVKNNQWKTFVLTAAHVCHSEVEEPLKKLVRSKKVEFKIETHDKKYHTFTIKSIPQGFIDGTSEMDLCVLEGSRIRIPSLHLALRGPKIGERVYNMAAPQGIYHPPTVPLLSGHYSGPIAEHHDLLTIPAIGGSSGSPILNKDGELIGVIFAANIQFPNISIGMDFESTRDFLHKSLNP